MVLREWRFRCFKPSFRCCWRVTAHDLSSLWTRRCPWDSLWCTQECSNWTSCGFIHPYPSNYL